MCGTYSLLNIKRIFYPSNIFHIIGCVIKYYTPKKVLILLFYYYWHTLKLKIYEVRVWLLHKCVGGGGDRFDQLLVTFTNSWSFYQMLVVFTNFGHFLVTTMPRVYKTKGLRQTERTNLEKDFYHRLQANCSVRKAATQYQVATMTLQVYEQRFISFNFFVFFNSSNSCQVL